MAGFLENPYESSTRGLDHSFRRRSKQSRLHVLGQPKQVSVRSNFLCDRGSFFAANNYEEVYMRAHAFQLSVAFACLISNLAVAQEAPPELQEAMRLRSQA